MGLRQKVQRDLLASALPADFQAEFHRLAEWAHTLPDRFANRVHVRLIDAASIEGFFKSLVRRFWRHPAFTIDGQRYVGSDFARVDALIARALRGKEAASTGRFTTSTSD